MAPSPLHGLNVVHPQQDNASYLSDQQDLLAASNQYPDLAAQLDIWTNLTFQSDEPLIKSHDKRHVADSRSSQEDDKDEDGDPDGVANPNSHSNVIIPQNVLNIAQQQQHAQSHSNGNDSAFNVNSILAGFGIDPFLVPPVNAPQPSQAASLAQLLSTYPFASGAFPGPSSIASDALHDGGLDHMSSAEIDAPAKKARTRKSSNATSASAAHVIPDSPRESEFSKEMSSDPMGTPVTVAEDKRRRNTAASARFRAKKKEREVALEKRSKDLEGRVSELERECEALRRENGWLKGLVVGVTGGGTGGIPSLPPPPGSSSEVVTSSSAAKRKRDGL